MDLTEHNLKELTEHFHWLTYELQRVCKRQADMIVEKSYFELSAHRREEYCYYSCYSKSLVEQLAETGEKVVKSNKLP